MPRKTLQSSTLNSIKYLFMQYVCKLSTCGGTIICFLHFIISNGPNESFLLPYISASGTDKHFIHPIYHSQTKWIQRSSGLEMVTLFFMQSHNKDRSTIDEVWNKLMFFFNAETEHLHFRTLQTVLILHQSSHLYEGFI